MEETSNSIRITATRLGTGKYYNNHYDGFQKYHRHINGCRPAKVNLEKDQLRELGCGFSQNRSPVDAVDQLSQIESMKLGSSEDQDTHHGDGNRRTRIGGNGRHA